LPTPTAVDHPHGAATVAPRDDIEMRLLRLWESLLPAHGFGITDSFFDLGGHSLLLVRLLASIEQAFGRELSVGAVLAHPTIEALAVLLRRHGVAAAWSPIVELRSPAASIPLFCVHPIGGNVIGYLPLARRLPEGQGFYALQAPGLEIGTEPCSGVEELAALYLDAVVSVWPSGPYRLGGHSFGGLVAFEMARQLRRRGASIDLLVMIDTPAPIAKNRPQPIADDGEWLRRRARILERFYGVEMGLSDAAFRDQPESAQITEFLHLMRNAQLLAPDAGEDLIRRLIAVQRAGHAAAVDYRPDGYDGPIHLLRATDRRWDRDEDRAVFSDPLLDWPALTRDRIVVREVPGDHISMLNEPHVSTVADILSSWLRSCSDLVSPSSAN
jgi:surfactin family lipopeptide synthetase A